MDCLTDWIGIKWKGAEAPDSGLYINQLPGVSLKSIDDLANAEQVSFLGVWSDVQTRSLTRLKTEVTNYFSKRYQLRTISESLKLPTYYTNDTQNTPADANYRGFTYDMGWYASGLASIHIEYLNLYLLSDAPGLVIKVFEVADQQTAWEIDSFTVDAVAGWNRIKVLKNYSVYKIFVGYDATDIESVYMPLNTVWSGGYWWTSFMWGPPNSPYQAILRGASSDIPYGNLVELNNLYGMSGDISIICSFDEILCSNKEKFTECLWYLLGIELMTERLYSDRLNRYTTIDLKRAADLRTEFETRFMESMKSTFDGIELQTWDGCITCNAQVQLVHALP